MLRLQQFLDEREKSLKQGRDEARILVRIRHVLMCTYGFIPLRDFKEMSIPELFDLLHEIESDRKQEEKEMEKAKRKGRGGFR